MPERKGFEISPSIAIIIAGVIVAGAVIYTNVHPGPKAAADTDKVTNKVTLPTKDDHIIGSPSAEIVLIEYSDFQCPYCEMIYPNIKKIVAESGGKISWVMREFPLYTIHPQALPAALAAECVAEQKGSDGFWKFADTVFENQGKLSDPFYIQFATQNGLDILKFNDCVQKKKYADRITLESTEAQTAGGTGTPFTVIVNTQTGKQYPISGALPYEQIMAVIKLAQGRQ